jgi:hypothetical protein
LLGSALQSNLKQGVPDGFISYQKSKLCYILKSFRPENVGKFYGHLVYLMAICIICVCLVHFLRFGKLHPEKSGNPA